MAKKANIPFNDRLKERRFRATMDENGRFVMPVKLRRALGLEGAGAELIFDVVDGQVVLSTKLEGLRQAQAILQGIIGEGAPSLAEELIRERREEARRESGH